MANAKLSERERKQAREEWAKRTPMVTYVDLPCQCPMYEFPHHHVETQPIREPKKG